MQNHPFFYCIFISNLRYSVRNVFNSRKDRIIKWLLHTFYSVLLHRLRDLWSISNNSTWYVVYVKSLPLLITTHPFIVTSLFYQNFPTILLFDLFYGTLKSTFKKKNPFTSDYYKTIVNTKLIIFYENKIFYFQIIGKAQVLYIRKIGIHWI